MFDIVSADLDHTYFVVDDSLPVDLSTSDPDRGIYRKTPSIFVWHLWI